MKPSVQFPDPLQTDDEGLVAVGGELSSDYILSAYMQGIFPWFGEEDPILWWSPNPRLVLYPGDFKLSSSLNQLIRSNRFRIKIDRNFEAVINQCSKSPRSGQNGTWITNDMIKAYCELHQLGYAHSFETYLNDDLVGGLYGLSLGRIFFGESMFFKVNNASKFALYHLVEWCKSHQFSIIDAQQPTAHLKSLGAVEIDRRKYMQLLKEALVFTTLAGKWK